MSPGWGHHHREVVHVVVVDVVVNVVVGFFTLWFHVCEGDMT